MKKQQGFSIVMAVFILVVLSLLAAYMVKLSGVQNATSTYAIQGARAYQAARAGAEWSVARIINGGNCGNITAASPLNFTGLEGFSVALACSNTVYSEGPNNISVYKIKSSSTFATYNSPDFISRHVEVSIAN